MTVRYVISADGATSGKRAACAAVLSQEGRIIEQRSRYLPDVDGYTLAAEIAGVALAADFFADSAPPQIVTIETDNPDVPRVIQEGYRPPQFSRIPPQLLSRARTYCYLHTVTFEIHPRNGTAGLRRADRLAEKRLWRKPRRKIV